MNYATRVYKAMKDHPDWRFGQAAFNVAYKMNPEAADKYRGGPIDPFHNNGVVNEFITAFRKDIGELS